VFYAFSLKDQRGGMKMQLGFIESCLLALVLLNFLSTVAVWVLILYFFLLRRG
jgi:hypothetical protein